MMKVSRAAHYAWLNRPAKLITAKQLHLYRRAKVVFEQSRNSLGYRELRKRLCKEGFDVSVADNLLNQNLNPVAPNQVWAGDVT